MNPIALHRIEKLYCKNERAVLELARDDPDNGICLVAVAAILVASIRLHCLEDPLDMNYGGPAQLDCLAHYKKGDEMGYFQHGSTIIVFGTAGHTLCENIRNGSQIRMGEALLEKHPHTTDTMSFSHQERETYDIP